jgi:class 3 adenylate cyclase
MADPSNRRKLAAILSADVVGYSRLMAANEAATVETLKSYRDIITRLVVRRGGRVVNAPGDALLAEFPSAVEAVQAAVEIQKSLEGHNIDLEPDRRMQFRIGVNLGDVIEEADGTIYGDGVNIAARMEALAEGGGVCVSSTVYDAVEGKLTYGFDFLGEQQVKNIAKPVRVYRVRAEPRPISRRSALPNIGWKQLAMSVAPLLLIIAAGLWGMKGWNTRSVAARQAVGCRPPVRQYWERSPMGAARRWAHRGHHYRSLPLQGPHRHRSQFHRGLQGQADRHPPNRTRPQRQICS